MTEEKDSSKKSDTNTASLEEIVYPMYVPTDTYLSAQDVVKTEDGERVILTFTGESQFILIQENSSIKNNDSYYVNLTTSAKALCQKRFRISNNCSMSECNTIVT